MPVPVAVTDKFNCWPTTEMMGDVGLDPDIDGGNPTDTEIWLLMAGGKDGDDEFETTTSNNKVAPISACVVGY